MASAQEQMTTTPGMAIVGFCWTDGAIIYDHSVPVDTFGSEPSPSLLLTKVLKS